MASTSTINAWMEELASSLLNKSPPKSTLRSRKLLDIFRRRVRHHNFPRTNQFEVRNTLTGLEEKFQVLGRDDISDALYKRRLEIDQHYERWIPDVLDLLLHLSDNPLQKTRLTDLKGVAYSNELPPLLKWTDIEVEDPFDQHDPIWQIPDFSDLSSDEDEGVVSTAANSPTSTKQRQQEVGLSDHQRARVYEVPDLERANQNLQALRASNKGAFDVITEVQLLREILLMAQGYPSGIFIAHGDRFELNSHVELQKISNDTLRATLAQLNSLRTDLDNIKSWLEQERSATYLQTTHQMVDKSLQAYHLSLCSIEEHLIHPTSLQVTSLLKIVTDVEELQRPLTILADWIRNTKASDPIGHLDALYNAACETYFVHNTVGLNTLLPICVRAVEVYLVPIQNWLRSGILLPTKEQFFVRLRKAASSSSTLWNDLYELDLSGTHRSPKFLAEFVPDILSCGKTATFIRCIAQNSLGSSHESTNPERIQSKTLSEAFDSAIPFPAAFSTLLRNHFSALLAYKTQTLRHLLETKCGFSRTLDAFELIYLRKQGVLLDTIEAIIFSRIDRCMDNWNDQFVVADMLEEVYSNVECVDLESISVQSSYTSSRSMESRRRSVRILASLAIDYTLPWPIANIIPKTSLAAYRRIALHLTQIRRAKYVLERIAYLRVQSTAISDNPKDQFLAQTTTFVLIQFANTLYDHFTTGIATPLTVKMRDDLSTASNVDAMISVHRTYIADLEFACLTNKQLKMLRETLIGLLDMCIRFADLLSSPNPASNFHRGTEDSETGSFISAQSQRRRRRMKSKHEDLDDGSDEDDGDVDDDFENEGEGYSSFIVLGEDTSPVQEIRKLQVQFRRQLDFFIAGLRGVAGGGGTVENFEVLADRLEWKGKSFTQV